MYLRYVFFINLIIFNGSNCDMYNNSVRLLMTGKNSESSICQCIQTINDKAVEIYKDHTKTVTLHRNMHLKYLNNETTNKTNVSIRKAKNLNRTCFLFF